MNLLFPLVISRRNRFRVVYETRHIKYARVRVAKANVRTVDLKRFRAEHGYSSRTIDDFLLSSTIRKSNAQFASVKLNSCKHSGRFIIAGRETKRIEKNSQKKTFPTRRICLNVQFRGAPLTVFECCFRHVAESPKSTV